MFFQAGLSSTTGATESYMDHRPVDMARRPPYSPDTMLPVDPPSEEVLPQTSNGIAYPDYGPQTIHGSDLFFMNPSSPHMNTRQDASSFNRRTSNAVSPSMSTQLYPYHQQAFHQYYSGQPFQQNSYAQQTQLPSYEQRAPPAIANSPPPLPPKPTSMPIVYPPIRATTTYDQYISPTTSIPPPPLRRTLTDYEQDGPPATTKPLPSLAPLSPAPIQEEGTVSSPADNSNELALALAMSQSECNDRKRWEEQEEEDLARALAESMLSTGTNVVPSHNPFFLPPSNGIASPSQIPAGDCNSRTPSPPLPVEAPAPSSSRPISNSTQSTNIPVSNANYPQFGRSEKWHIPGAISQPTDKEQAPDIKSTSSMKSHSAAASPTPSYDLHSPKPSTRPASIASASSLPYKQDELTSQQLESNVTFPPDTEAQGSNPDAVQTDGANSTPRTFSPQPSSSAVPSDDLIVPSNVEELNALVFDDEAYARQLAAEEEEMARQEEEQQRHANEKGRPIANYTEDIGQALPLYQQGDWQVPEASGSMSSGPRPSSSVTESSRAASYSSSAHQPPEYSRPPLGRHTQSESPEFEFRQISSLTGPGPSTSPYVPFQSGPVSYPSLGRRRESDSDLRSEASHQSSNHSTASAPPVSYSDVPARLQDPRRPSIGATANSAPQLANGRPIGAAPAQMAPSPGILNANHFLDRELLLGVSIGFKPPAISTALLPMQDPMPNMISLPYARCPPLHLQAPDWRHLLRLMARLSGTRIEPTVEAMAISKTDLHLRTVVQFIKPHPNSNDWRTILWFTIDHPVPPGAPGSSRYLSGNPNLLPWSYTLCPVPMLLRDASDTQISKTFTIPATDKVPLPTLPITFPNLALYLQAALDDSRRHPGDTSSGLGKLGKVVQLCYPSMEPSHSEFDIPDRSSVTHLFKRVMGRSNKDRKKGKTTNNEETYQLVTPFVPDEWG